jgi:phosphotransferase system HPr-like phosphotransfer protein
MMLAATRGTQIKICAVGVDAVQAVNALSDLVKRKFDEE